MAYRRENRLGAQLLITRLVAASARNVPLVASRDWELQQLGQRGCPGPVHGRTHGRLQSFHLPTPRLAAGAEGHAQQLVYFTRDFLLDGFGRFFSWADGAVSPTGRNSQICSLTSNS